MSFQKRWRGPFLKRMAKRYRQRMDVLQLQQQELLDEFGDHLLEAERAREKELLTLMQGGSFGGSMMCHWDNFRNT